MRTMHVRLMLSLLLLPESSVGFGVLPDLSSVSQLAPAAQNLFDGLAQNYQHALQTDALKTQVETGIALAVVGDAIAQKTQTSGEPYDVNRAASFAAFDACYRAVQHYLYPPMIAACNGAFLGTLLPNNNEHFAAAVEQALVSQVVIIPIIYYPVFFALTGAVQGLTVEETVNRAKETFWPLMTRNWLFWLPVQFAAFGFVPNEDAQISILIACGLVWTIILSAFAGSTKEYSYCVTGMEDECILPDELFPIEELAVEIQEIEHEMEVAVTGLVHDMEDVVNVALHLETENGKEPENEKATEEAKEEEEALMK